MTDAWTSNASLEWLRRVTAPGVLGIYSHCEVTEVLAFDRTAPTNPVNVLSIIVLENHPIEPSFQQQFLNGNDHIELCAHRDWFFGVYRYYVPVSKLLAMVERFATHSIWDLSGKLLRLDEMVAVAPLFAPADTTEATPLNRVLKNNFWGGSYVLEWFDKSKLKLQPFLNDPPSLQALSEEVQKYIPIQIGSLSDRFGNLLIQIPITAIRAEFSLLQNSEAIAVSVAWHPHVKSRRLIASCFMEYDKVFCGYGVDEIQNDSVVIRTNDSSQLNRCLIWDPEHQLILAGIAQAYLREISISASVGDPEPRVFKKGGEGDQVKVWLHSPGIQSRVGDASSHDYRDWTRRRIYDEEALQLATERRFVQYRPKPEEVDASHEKALSDIHHLISRHGAGGAWLWDPYLDARDILDTLFFCPHIGADLRALTAGKIPPEIKRISYAEKQRAIFDSAESNYRGLRLTYRIKSGTAGWKFHDRFLIFPNSTGQVLAWSLGASINILGKAHHILQRVDNGRLIMEAFLDLWDQLSAPEHTILEKP